MMFHWLKNLISQSRTDFIYVTMHIRDKNNKFGFMNGFLYKADYSKDGNTEYKVLNNVMDDLLEYFKPCSKKENYELLGGLFDKLFDNQISGINKIKMW